MEFNIDANAKLENINTRVELHGDDKVTACDLKITCQLKAEDLDQCMIDGNSISSAFWTKDGEPKLRQLDKISITNGFEDHKVKIGLSGFDGKIPMITMPQAKINKISFIPRSANIADVTFRVQGELTGSEIGQIIDKYLQELIEIKAEATQTDMVDGAENG